MITIISLSSSWAFFLLFFFALFPSSSSLNQYYSFFCWCECVTLTWRLENEQLHCCTVFFHHLYIAYFLYSVLFSIWYLLWCVDKDLRCSLQRYKLQNICKIRRQDSRTHTTQQQKNESKNISEWSLSLRSTLLTDVCGSGREWEIMGKKGQRKKNESVLASHFLLFLLPFLLFL